MSGFRVQQRSESWSLAGDVAIAVVVLGLAALPALNGQGLNLAELPARPLDVLGVVTLVAQCAPIVVRRRWPAACLVVVGVAFAVFQLRGYPQTFASLGLVVALYNAGAHLSRGRVQLAVAALAVYVALAVGLAVERSPEQSQDYVTFGLLLAACWGTGAWARGRATASETDRRHAEEALLAAERTRIARELHDVVTNHVTAIVVQADAGQFVPDTKPVLDTISTSGRNALADLRHLLGVLNGTEWAPSLAQLPDLIDRSTAAGQPVALTESGTARPMSREAETAAYRVVQEALTNALKHAPGRPTTVLVRHGDERLELEITTDRPDRPGIGKGSGQGLKGLQDRLVNLGGTLTANHQSDGQFRLTAHIPTE